MNLMEKNIYFSRRRLYNNNSTFRINKTLYETNYDKSTKTLLIKNKTLKISDEIFKVDDEKNKNKRIRRI